MQWSKDKKWKEHKQWSTKHDTEYYELSNTTPTENRNTEVIRKTVPHNCKKKHIWGRRGRDRMVVDFTTTYSISAYHHLFVRSNPAIGDLYSIQHYVIQFVRDFGRSPGTPFSTTNKTDCHYLGEILVKVMLNTIILSLSMRLYILK
jgi:hypothetical protein